MMSQAREEYVDLDELLDDLTEDQDEIGIGTFTIVGNALAITGQRRARVSLCSPWDPYGGPSSVMSEQTGASLDVVLDAYTVSILRRTTRATGEKRSALVLGVHSDAASFSVSDKEGRGTQLRPDGLLIYDSTRSVVYKTPGTTDPDP